MSPEEKKQERKWEKPELKVFTSAELNETVLYSSTPNGNPELPPSGPPPKIP